MLPLTICETARPSSGCLGPKCCASTLPCSGRLCVKYSKYGAAQVWVGIHMQHGGDAGLQGAIKRWRSTQTALPPGAELPSLIAPT